MCIVAQHDVKIEKLFVVCSVRQQAGSTFQFANLGSHISDVGFDWDLNVL